MSPIQFVQIVLTDEQAQLVAKAIPLALESTTPEQWGDFDEGMLAPIEEDLKRLAVFFTAVADEPSRWPVTGRMAAKIKKMTRRDAGPAQKRPRNRKSVRRQSQQKHDRAKRRAEAENYNQARERVEQDMKEAEEAQAADIARLEYLLAQPHVHDFELVELFDLLGAKELSQKAIALREREANPQSVIDAAAEAAREICTDGDSPCSKPAGHDGPHYLYRP